MAHGKLLYKNPEVDLKRKYPKWKELGFIITLGLLTILFYAFKDFKPSLSIERSLDITFITEEIPQTEQYQRPPAPDTPIIPAESEDPDLPDYIPDWDSEIDEDDAIVSPPLDGNVEEPEVPFFKLTEEPKVISRVLPVYPPIAIKADITGKVYVEILIDTNGNVEESRIVQGHPMLNEAALEAVRQWKFKPAKQRDRLVKVRISIPIEFKLKN